MRSYDRASQRLLVISPVKDEAATLDRTIRSVVAQTVRPSQWVIVVDGGGDDTVAIANAAARVHPWIKVVQRPDRKTSRRVGPLMAEAFREGLRQADVPDYDFLCKLDGGLELAPGYFGALLRRFAADPRLGMIGGEVSVPAEGWDVPGRPVDDSTSGGATLYRCICFQEIGGFDLDRAVLWDGIDAERCRKLGWKAARDSDPSLSVRQLRPTPSTPLDSCRSRFRWGRDQWVMGTTPQALVGTALRRMFRRPWVLGGLCILAGYLDARLHPRPTDDDRAFRRYLHRWQLIDLSEQLFRRREPAGAGAQGLATPTIPLRPNFRLRWAERVVSRHPRTRARQSQAGH